MSCCELTIENSRDGTTNGTLVELLCDLAGVDKLSCRHIELVDGEWHFEMYARNLKGSIPFDSYGVFTYTHRWAA